MTIQVVGALAIVPHCQASGLHVRFGGELLVSNTPPEMQPAIARIRDPLDQVLAPLLPDDLPRARVTHDVVRVAKLRPTRLPRPPLVDDERGDFSDAHVIGTNPERGVSSEADEESDDRFRARGHQSTNPSKSEPTAGQRSYKRTCTSSFISPS